MKETAAALKIVLANTFVLYFRSHSYHWNIEGPNFSQYHKYFGDFYEDIFDACDAIAEQIRVQEQYAPISIKDLLSASTIKEDTSKPDTKSMFVNLLKDNEQVILSLYKVIDISTKNNDQGLLNFIADRIDKHEKHGWMLKSFQK